MSDGSSVKRWQHRTRLPEETCAWLDNVRDLAGITRVADITGLDCIGIPVFQSVRPMGRLLTVSQGKGVSAIAAKASAMMEAVEIWHAESETLERTVAPKQALSDRIIVEHNNLRKPKSRHISEDAPQTWCAALDLETGKNGLVPGDAANLDFTCSAQPSNLARSTTGLAGGNTHEEARVSALCEVIERSCSREFQRFGRVKRAIRRLSATCLSQQDVTVGVLVDRIRAADLHLDLFDITNEFDVPAIRAVLYEVKAGEPSPWPSLGHGAHLDPMTAVIRAITEAAQSRLTGISGNRDDISPGHYSGAELTNQVLTVRRNLDFADQGRGLDREDLSTNTAHEDADILLDRILRKGKGPVAEVTLTRPDLGIPVVKILAPNVAFLAS